MEKLDAKARSPWALQGYRQATMFPVGRPVDMTMRVPGSKSYTNRALILAATARGPSTLSGILRSDDSYWCIDALQKLGVPISVDDDTAQVQGCDAHWPAAAQNVFIGSAGTTARFLPGILAAGRGGACTIDASSQLKRRPIAAVVEALQALGAQISYLAAPGALPVRVVGAGLHGGEVRMSGSVSSQFISGVLLASPYAQSAVTLRIADTIVQHAYVMMTLDMMQAFGVGVGCDATLQTMQIAPQRYVGAALSLEADASTAGYFLALAAITAGRMRISNLGETTRQPDIKLLDVLERLGCVVQRGPGWVEVRGAARLRGGFVQSMQELSDQTLTLAAVAAFADAPVTITDVGHIRHHESDRIAVVCGNLRTLGLRIDERDDGLTVHPGPMQGAAVGSFDDHRVAMSMALIGARVPGVQILDPGCVSKTCPTFFAELARTGVRVDLQ